MTGFTHAEGAVDAIGQEFIQRPAGHDFHDRPERVVPGVAVGVARPRRDGRPDRAEAVHFGAEIGPIRVRVTLLQERAEENRRDAKAAGVGQHLPYGDRVRLRTVE